MAGDLAYGETETLGLIRDLPSAVEVIESSPGSR
jgi:hypothetical protein